MEIDATSIIIGLGMLLLFMAPIIFYQMSVGKKDRALVSLLKETAKKNHSGLDEKETFRTGFALGLDTEKRLLIWVRREQETNVTQSEVYFLKEYDKCSVYKSQSGLSKQDGSILHEIGINLKTGSNKNSVNIPICSVRQGWLAGDEIRQAEIWAKRVQSLIAS